MHADEAEDLSAELDARADAYGPKVTDADTVDSFLGKNGRFAKEIPGFTARTGQLELSRAAKDAFDRGQILVAEAGTGTGKTYAYLLPTILCDKTAVISTGSKALQDQLLNKDLPRICDLLHVPRNYFALKGFSNYLCKAKFAQFIADFKNKTGLAIEDPDPEHRRYVALVSKLVKFMVQQQSMADQDDPRCEYAEVNSRFPHDFIAPLCCDRHSCRGKKCKYHSSCFALMARQRAVRFKIVVVNHALFFADMGVEDNFDPTRPCILFPKYKILIFDEAHQLPDDGRKHLGREVSSYDIKKLGEDLEALIKAEKLDIIEEFKKGYARLKTAAEHLHAYLASRGSPACRNFLFYRYEDFDESSADPGRKYEKISLEFRRLMAELWTGIKEFHDFIADIKSADDEAFGSMSKELMQMRLTIEDLMHLNDEEQRQKGENVGSVEVNRYGFALKITPLEISGIMGKFFEKCESAGVGVLAASATLSVAGNFAKFRRDMGLGSMQVSELCVESCFDYASHAALLVSKDFPEVNTAGREERIVCMLEKLIGENEGGIFVLTTSVNAVGAFAESLRRRFMMQRRILVQNGKLSNSDLLQEFRRLGNAVLVGTSSFWAGVDVPGNALTLVIIDKLPFQSPSDPVYKARCDHYDSGLRQGARSFMELSVPEAVIELRQGAGRLIRHEKDTGVLVICDPRIVKKGYGSMFMKSLPPVTICKDLEDLFRFKAGLKNFNRE